MGSALLTNLGPLVAPSLCSGCYSLSLGFLKSVDPSDSASSYYIDWSHNRLCKNLLKLLGDRIVESWTACCAYYIYSSQICCMHFHAVSYNSHCQHVAPFYPPIQVMPAASSLIKRMTYFTHPFSVLHH